MVVWFCGENFVHYWNESALIVIYLVISLEPEKPIAVN